MPNMLPNQFNGSRLARPLGTTMISESFMQIHYPGQVLILETKILMRR